VHKLFARQLAKARTASGGVDLALLGELVISAYAEMERDRRRTDRSISLMAKEVEQHLFDRERAAELLRVQKLQLDTALNNMRQGLLMFDREGRVVVINKSYIEMYRLSPELAKPGCTVRDLLQQRAANGMFAGDIDKYINAHIVRDRVVDKVFEMPDGRLIRVVNRSMEAGGWVSTHEDVTQQRKAEAALKQAVAESERAEADAIAAHMRLREAFEVVPEGLALFDAEDRYVLWNRRYAELYARTPNARSPNAIKVGARFEDVLRTGLAAGLFADAQGREQEWLAERLALHAQDSSTHEQRIPGNRWLRICERRTADGGSVGIRIDISELKQREESVRALFEFNPVPLMVVDCDDLKFLAVNDAAVRLYGYSREQFLAMTKLDLLPREERQRYLELFGIFRQSERLEFHSATNRRHRKADGNEILVNVFGRKLNYENRSALLCSIIDVTERVRAEEERDRNRDFLDRIIDNVTMTILVKDARTLQYVLANRAAERLWGFSRSEMIGKTPHEVFDKETAELVEANDRKLLESGSNFYLPAHKIDTRNGPRMVTSNRVAVRNQSGEVQYVLGVVEDVTERKHLDDQLRQAQKMEAVGNLTGGIAHDFNNLLTIIVANLDLLSEDVAGNAKAEQKIATIAQAAERGADLTRHMLAFSRRQPLQAKEVDINGLIAGTTRLLSRALGGNIAVTLRTGVPAA
jgi:PAS domain S-box-containing protein